MSDPLSVSVISPERVLFEGRAMQVVVPAHDGEMGILTSHAPLMSILGQGVLRIETSSGEVRYNVSRGFLQVVDDRIRVVTESASEA